MKRDVIFICIFLIFCGGCTKKVDTKEFLTLPIFRDNLKDGKFYYQGKGDDMLVICTRTLSCHDWDGFDYYAGAHSKCYDVIKKDIKSSISSHKNFLPEAGTLTLHTSNYVTPQMEVAVDAFIQLLSEKFVEIPTIFEIHDISMDRDYSESYEYEYMDQEIQKTRVYVVTYVEEGVFIKITDLWYINDESIENYERYKYEELSFTFFYAD